LMTRGAWPRRGRPSHLAFRRRKVPFIFSTLFRSLLPSLTGTRQDHMASADNNEHHDGDALNKKARAWNWENPQSPLLWVVFASTSLLSARHILVESNFHYPVLVYLAQLFMTTIVVTIQIPWRDKARRHSSGRPSPRRIRRGTLLALGAVSFTALSMLCMLQAILHFTNLPTLVMLVVSRLSCQRTSER
jgi:hypothetical protein